MQHKIENGPFKGSTFESTDTYVTADDSGNERSNVFLTKMTQMFLSIFDPLAGWGVTISGELEKLDLVPLANQYQPQGGGYVPTAKFTAKLLNPNGVTVATASSLWTIDGPTAWEKGETNARLRLYDALGLQSKFGAQDVPPVQHSRPRLQSVPLKEQRRVEVRPAEPVETSVPEAKPLEAESPTSGAETDTAKSVAETDADNDSTVVGVEPAKVVSSEVPAQSQIELGSEATADAPPAAMLAQIERLAKLMSKPVPKLATRVEATDFLKRLQKGEV